MPRALRRPLPPPAHDASPLPPRTPGPRRHPPAARRAVRGDPRRPPAGAGSRPAAGERRSAPGRRLPARRGLAGGQPARRRTGVPGPRPSPFERVAQAGIAVASVDYRLSGEATWPAQLHDAKAAVRWLRARAGELGIDPERIAAWGESAGGHLAELLGLTEDDAGARGRRRHHRTVERASSAVVAWYAPSDVAAVADRHRRRPGRPDHPRGAAARRPGARRARARRAGQPDQPRLPRRPAVPAAARRGRPVHPVRPERAAAHGARRGRAPRPSSTSTRTPTTCGSARPTPRRQALTAPRLPAAAADREEDGR